MFLQFFLKVKVKQGNVSRMLKDQSEIVSNYLRGWFIIDLLSIFPIDPITAPTQENADSSGSTLKILKLVMLDRDTSSGL